MRAAGVSSSSLPLGFRRREVRALQERAEKAPNEKEKLPPRSEKKTLITEDAVAHAHSFKAP